MANALLLPRISQNLAPAPIRTTRSAAAQPAAFTNLTSPNPAGLPPGCQIPTALLLQFNPAQRDAYIKAHCSPALTTAPPAVAAPLQLPAAAPGFAPAPPTPTPFVCQVPGTVSFLDTPKWMAANCWKQQAAVKATSRAVLAPTATLNKMFGASPKPAQPKLLTPMMPGLPHFGGSAGSASSNDIPANTLTTPSVTPITDMTPAIVPVGVPSALNTMPDGSAVYAGNATNAPDSLALQPVQVATSNPTQQPIGVATMGPTSEEAPAIPKAALIIGGVVAAGAALFYAHSKRWI